MSICNSVKCAGYLSKYPAPCIIAFKDVTQARYSCNNTGHANHTSCDAPVNIWLNGNKVNQIRAEVSKQPDRSPQGGQLGNRISTATGERNQVMDQSISDDGLNGVTGTGCNMYVVPCTLSCQRDSKPVRQEEFRNVDNE